MTGREMILYILSNGLENEPVVKDGRLVGFMSIDEAAARMNVGSATIHVWVWQKQLPFVSIGDTIYIPANAKSPLEQVV